MTGDEGRCVDWSSKARVPLTSGREWVARSGNVEQMVTSGRSEEKGTLETETIGERGHVDFSMAVGVI